MDFRGRFILPNCSKNHGRILNTVLRRYFLPISITANITRRTKPEPTETKENKVFDFNVLKCLAAAACNVTKTKYTLPRHVIWGDIEGMVKKLHKSDIRYNILFYLLIVEIVKVSDTKMLIKGYFSDSYYQAEKSTHSLRAIFPCKNPMTPPK